ncbi:cellulase family glycosylhydrolase [Saccharothrix xinjiangensis]|uniref:cellulase n=1 Tax=Saccharothrix xinjiangensis TaxID=204798 RepID=A0ABV9YC45_9PSEU
MAPRPRWLAAVAASALLAAPAPWAQAAPAETAPAAPAASTPTALATTEHQAEGASVSGGVVESNHAGYTGGGFVNYDNAPGSHVEFTVTAQAGPATLALRYANGTTTNRPMTISVNGTAQASGVAFAGTGAWSTWRTATANVTLAAGVNRVRVAATTAAGGPNLDRLDVTAGSPPPGRPADVNGQLRVCGTKLCNKHGKPIQLRGMSTHGIQWYAQCVKPASLDALATDWGADVLRISMYVQEGGYETDPRRFTDLVHGYIEEATRRGLYALVDWHQLSPGDPNANLALARTFFTEVASRHRDKTNIIYDIANEPNGVAWSAIKSYAEQMIPVIRAQDPDGVVFVGTHGWGSLGISDGRSEQDIVNNPINATNFMYTFHFYAASHQDEYFNALTRAAARLPIFVTEFGTQTYTGDGANDFAYSQKYLDFLAANKIGWTNWNFSDDFRSGAVFKEGTCAGNSFAGTSVLKPAGQWIRERMRTPDDFPTS